MCNFVYFHEKKYHLVKGFKVAAFLNVDYFKKCLKSDMNK